MIARSSFLSVLFMLLTYSAYSQKNSANVGKKVTPVEIRDMDNNPVMLPYLGEKNLLVFYVDPDKQNQNSKFREYLEQNQINSDNIYGFGIINLKDAPFYPNAVVRPLAAKKAKETGAVIYSDPNHLLKNAWDLGDCNNKFMIIFVNKDQVIEFCRWGDYSEEDIAEFWRVIDKYK